MINMFIYSFFMFMMFLLFLCVSMYMFMVEYSMMFEWLFLNFNSINIEFLILIDWVSSVFISLVMLISSMIMLYSVVYMSGEKFISRFMFLMVMFIMSMILMIISPNLISILFGWDGLGLVSYSLIIYYQNYSSFNSGMVTVLSNRFGDISLLMSIGIMMMYGSWSLLMMSENKLVLLMIIIAALTKSAQIPFSSWLPMAMAAPTPVSALVHSSTLVTAGVYLLIRFNKYLMMSGLNLYVLFLSILTMFMSGLMANFEYDLKKIIALSTLSQLGLMMMILSLNLPMFSFYHLLTHAIFKSLLFMCAGIIIHHMNNNQDIRMYGKLNEFFPFTMVSFYISSMSLCGFPFLSGFYSKDMIMEMIYINNFNCFYMFMAGISLLFTVSYSFRLIYYMYFGSINMSSYIYLKENNLLSGSMMLLMLLSIMVGSMLGWMFFFDFYLIFLKVSIKLVTLSICLLGIIMGSIMYLLNLLNLYYVSFFFSSMWFLNYLFLYIYKPINEFSDKLYFMDKVWLEFSGKLIYINLSVSYMVLSFKLKIYMFIYMFILFMIIMLMII